MIDGPPPALTATSTPARPRRLTAALILTALGWALGLAIVAPGLPDTLFLFCLAASPLALLGGIGTSLFAAVSLTGRSRRFAAVCLALALLGFVIVVGAGLLAMHLFGDGPAQA